MHTWQRFGDKPVVVNVGESRWAISGNPQVVKIGDLWVMFYFGAFWKPKSFDTFAPLGPCLVTPDELPKPNALGIRTIVSGETLHIDGGQSAGH